MRTVRSSFVSSWLMHCKFQYVEANLFFLQSVP
jgi:hypothetical protein